MDFRGGGAPKNNAPVRFLALLSKVLSKQFLFPKASFTLAEVLTTLGIIGIVAAMTMPALIAKHKKVVLVTRLKKVYSVTSNAIMLSEAENGFIKYWDFGTEYSRDNLKRVVDTYLKPYFKTISTVESKTDNGSYNTYGFTLSDGTTLLFSLDGSINSGKSPATIMILADFKGRKASNNKKDLDYSRDNFEMEISKYRGKLRFFTWASQPYASTYTREELINHSKYGCNPSIPKYHRYNCGALIQYDGWKILEDYPW
ncbi:hypothetical protein DBY21_04445 [Candidatus Gastranaerophilales bacterium]|nr:MAG: hypothetical protein DBY21_04445 [Candidatus Gastranaerophilales bacterium]